MSRVANAIGEGGAEKRKEERLDGRREGCEEERSSRND